VGQMTLTKSPCFKPCFPYIFHVSWFNLVGAQWFII
jgi:hypothetical protein